MEENIICFYCGNLLMELNDISLGYHSHCEEENDFGLHYRLSLGFSN
jgi:hypothetical protein